jgi:hydrogenase maturation factor
MIKKYSFFAVVIFLISFMLANPGCGDSAYIQTSPIKTPPKIEVAGINSLELLQLCKVLDDVLAKADTTANQDQKSLLNQIEAILGTVKSDSKVEDVVLTKTENEELILAMLEGTIGILSQSFLGIDSKIAAALAKGVGELSAKITAWWASRQMGWVKITLQNRGTISLVYQKDLKEVWSTCDVASPAGSVYVFTRVEMETVQPDNAGSSASAVLLKAVVDDSKVTYKFGGTLLPPADIPGKDVPENFPTFFENVLVRLNIPVSEFATKALAIWARYEDTGAHWNPLATTRKMGDKSTDFNASLVQNYDDLDTGINATVETLGLSYYEAIQQMLSMQSFSRENIKKSLAKWSGLDSTDSYVTNLVQEWETLYFGNTIPTTTSVGKMLVWDDFESNTLTGGQGWSTDSIWQLNNAIVTQAAPKEGKYCLQVSGYAIRSIDAFQANTRLQFWAKTSGFGTYQYITVSWKGREVKRWLPEDGDGIYRFWDIDLSSLGAGRGDLYFGVSGSGNAVISIDDIKVVPGTTVSLPANTLSWDNFESGTLTGGQGWSTDSIWQLNNAIVTQAAPKEGKYCLQVSGYAIRSIDAFQANTRLQFWAKTSGFGTYQYITVSWKGREVKRWLPEDGDGIYRFWDIDLSSLGAGRGDLYFGVSGSGNAVISIDDIKVVF